MQFCRYCGGRTPDDSVFCASCGQRLFIPPEDVTSISDAQQAEPMYTPPPDAPTVLSQPLQTVSSNDVEDEKEEQQILPPVVSSEAPSTGNIPSVQGTPQVGTVPSVPGGAGTAAATLTAGTMAKVLLIAATCAAVIFAGIKVVPIFIHAQIKPSGAPTMVPMPPTQTSCPPAGQARAAVMRTLVLGTHQNIVYFEDEVHSGTTTFGTLKRYDVTTGQTTEIVKLANMNISQAQLSTDGQWILFVDNEVQTKLSKLQMIRIDGQGLQTLYCSTADEVRDVQWSPNQRFVALLERSASTTAQFGKANAFVLNILTGNVKTIISEYYFSPYKWLDNTRLYIATNESADGPATLFVLDTSRSSVQQFNDMAMVYSFPLGSYGDATSSVDGSELFVSNTSTTDGGNSGGSSNISVEPATGGTQRSIFTSPTLAIVKIRTISSTTLLLLVNAGNANGADTSKNGLWEIGTDGQSLKNLTLDSAGTVSYLNLFAQSPCSNVSRDSTMYALAAVNTQGVSLLFGSLKGGTPKTFASSEEIEQNPYYSSPTPPYIWQ